MIAKILDMNAIEQQRINLRLEKVDICSLLQETISNIQATAIKKYIQVHFATDTTESYAALDWGYATQIFENLLSNAVKFSPAYKHIYVQVQANAEHIQISIQDEGPGFSAEDMGKLFGKFQKLSARPTGGETSTGLGLSIVKKYVEAMQGSIHCENNQGQGAKFVLTFSKYPLPYTQMIEQ
jgi:signal transduction histidine kinase